MYRYLRQVILIREANIYSELSVKLGGGIITHYIAFFFFFKHIIIRAMSWYVPLCPAESGTQTTRVSLRFLAILKIPSYWMRRGVGTGHCAQVESGWTFARIAQQHVTRHPALCAAGLPLLRTKAINRESVHAQCSPRSVWRVLYFLVFSHGLNTASGVRTYLCVSSRHHVDRICDSAQLSLVFCR